MNIKYRLRYIAKIILFPVVIYKRKVREKKLVDANYIERKENTIRLIKQYYKKDYITIYNKDWFGVSSSTKELFDNLVDCGEIYRKKDIKEIGNSIIEAKVKQVIFSSFAIGWKELAKYLKKKNPQIKLKSFSHASHSQVLEYYGWNRNLELINLHKRKIIDVLGTCKKSLVSFYEKQGYRTKFITNKVKFDNNFEMKKEIKDYYRIGIYAASCTDWRKNMYPQIAAVSLIDNAVIDMVPISDEALEFAKSLNVKIIGEKQPLSREKLIERIALDDAVLYVSFSECAPMLPLEALEVKTPCLTGNNHHYFKNDPLENYLVVDEEDNPNKIKEKLLNVLENRNKLSEMYEKFSQKNNAESQEEVKEFLEM